MAVTSKPVPYRIVCRCVPSPQSKRYCSRPWRAESPDRYRPAVGLAADVPRKVRRSMAVGHDDAEVYRAMARGQTTRGATKGANRPAPGAPPPAGSARAAPAPGSW